MCVVPLLLPLLFAARVRRGHAAEEYPEAFTDGLPMWIYFAIGFASVIFLLLGDDEKKDSSSEVHQEATLFQSNQCDGCVLRWMCTQIRSPIPTGSIVATDASANAATAAATTTDASLQPGLLTGGEIQSQ